MKRKNVEHALRAMMPRTIGSRNWANLNILTLVDRASGRLFENYPGQGWSKRARHESRACSVQLCR